MKTGPSSVGLALLLAISLSAVGHAQDIPYRGMVTSVAQGSGLTWECAAQGPGIQCEFIQTMVRQEAPLSPEQRNSRIEAALADIADRDVCQRLLAEIANAQANQVGDLEARNRDAFESYARAMTDFCDAPSLITAAALIDLGERSKARSCKIGTLPFDLNFSWNTQSARWETVSPPEGGCGVVTMVFLEKDKEYSTFWNYREISLVTNKTGTDVLRGDCSAWPEDDMTYRWQPDNLTKTCEFVSFGY